MKKFPFVICPNALPIADRTQFFKAVARTTVNKVEIRSSWLPPKEMEQSSAQICAVGICGNFALTETQQQLLKIMAVAAQHRIPLVNIACLSKITPADQLESAAFFRDAAACAQELDLRFTLETFGAISRTATECLKLLDRVGHEALKICYDTANVWRFAPEFTTPDKLTNDFCQLKEHIAYIHLKDFDPVNRQIMALGQGQVDFPAIFAKLAEWDFPGFIGLDLETARARKINTLAAHEAELHLSLDFLTACGIM